MKKILCAVITASLLLSATVSASALVNGVFLGSDQNGVNILNDKLRPGEEYYFPVLVAVDGAPPAQLTSADIDRNSLTVRVATGGAVIRSATVEERGGMVYIALTPGKVGTVQDQTASLRINYRSKDSNDNVTVLPEVKVGYPPMPDDVFAALDPGEFLETDNATPIFTPSQWNSLAELNEFREVTLGGSDWRFTVNTTKLGKRNMLATHDPVMSLVQDFPNHQMHFISFPGEPDFEVKGKLTLDVTSLAEDFGHDFFLYRCAYGKLFPLTYEYDREAGELSFHPSQLSTYLVTDKRISLSDNVPNGPGSSEDGSQPVPPVENPNTGGSGGGIMAYIVSLVSLAGLGIMTASKRR